MGTKNSGTQTQTTQPPAYALPYLQQGMGAASSLFANGGKQYYPGSGVASFSPQQQQAFDMTAQRATNGSPEVNAGSQYIQKMLGGGGQTNPFLDQMFQRAADQSRSTLDSQFASYGRNLDAQLPFRQQQVNDLATQFYGGQYNADQNRNAALLPQALQYGQQPYQDAAQLAGVGQQVQGQSQNIINDNMNRFNFGQQQPYDQLNQYIQQITGQTQGGQTSQPLYRNVGAGILGGGLAGGQLGGMFGNNQGLGAILGGLLGGLG
jgi:hypothetical protein